MYHSVTLYWCTTLPNYCCLQWQQAVVQITRYTAPEDLPSLQTPVAGKQSLGARMRTVRTAVEPVVPLESYPMKKMNPPSILEKDMLRLPDASKDTNRRNFLYALSCPTFSLKAHEKDYVAPPRVTPAKVFVLRPVNKAPRTPEGSVACLARIERLVGAIQDVTNVDNVILFMDAGR